MCLVKIVDADVQTTNPFFTQGEIDVIGISSVKKIVYLCEVATHLETGLKYVRERMPDNVKRLFKKFEKDIRYATTYFNEFNKVTFVVILCINTERQQAIRYNNYNIYSTVGSNMEIDDIFAKEHIHRWTKAWNDHDIKEILCLYSENILFSSPKIKSVYLSRTSATITNKKDLEEYFSSVLKKFPMLHFIPIDYFLKNHKVIFEYNATPDNKIKWSVIEKFEFNNYGLIEKSNVYYGVED